MAPQADVVVIGAGVIGCACAYFLARDGHQVTVLERDEVASGTAAASGGWVVIQHGETPNAIALARESRQLYDLLAADADVPVSPTGGMIVAASEAEMDHLRAQAAVARAAGVRVEEVDRSALLDLEPALAPDLLGAVLCPDEAVVDPVMVCRALIGAAVRRGARVLTGTPVVAIGTERGRVSEIRTPSSRIPTPRVVCASGVWSAAIGRMVGVEIPVLPRRGHLLFTEFPPVRRPVLEAGYMEVRGGGATDDPSGVRFIMQPRADGSCLVGSSREFRGEDRTPDERVVERIWVRGTRYVPALRKMKVTRVQVGFRPYTPLGRPIIGTAGPEGFLIATGHEGEGITLAPVTGRIVADLVAARINRTGFELHRVPAPGW